MALLRGPPRARRLLHPSQLQLLLPLLLVALVALLLRGTASVVAVGAGAGAGAGAAAVTGAAPGRVVAVVDERVPDAAVDAAVKLAQGKDAAWATQLLYAVGRAGSGAASPCASQDADTQVLARCPGAKKPAPGFAADAKKRLSGGEVAGAAATGKLLRSLAGAPEAAVAAQVVKDAMKDALGAAKVERDTLHFDGSVEATGALVASCGLHAGCLEKGFAAEELDAVARYLARGFASPASAPAAKAAAALGLRALSEQNRVLAITLEPAEVAPSAKAARVQVKVTTLLGAPAAPGKWELLDAPAAVVPEDTNGAVLVDASKFPASGALMLAFKLLDGVRFEREVRLSAVAASFAPARFAAVASKAAGGARREATAAHPGSATLALEEGETLEATIKVLGATGAAVRPQQAVLRLSPVARAGGDAKAPASTTTRAASSGEFYAALTSSGDAAGELRASVPVSKLADPLGYASGEYDATVVVSDASLVPASWRAARLSIKFARSAPEPKRLPLFERPLLHDSDTTLVPLPEIHHQFRPADRRAPALVALLFSGGIVALLVAFVGVAAYLGFLGRIAKSALTPLSLSVAVVLALDVWYWLGPGVGAPDFVVLLLYYMLPAFAVLCFFLARHAASRTAVAGDGAPHSKAE